MMAQAFQNTLTVTRYGRNGFLKFANKVSLLPKMPFFTVSLERKKLFLPWKWQTTMRNQMHHPRAEINTVFLSLGLGYHQNKIIGLEFSKR